MPNDRALMLKYDAPTASTFVLVQGSTDADRAELYQWLRTMQRYGGHPLLMIALFFEMQHKQLKSFYENIRGPSLKLSLDAFSEDIARLSKYKTILQRATGLYEDCMIEDSEASATVMRLRRLMGSFDFVRNHTRTGASSDEVQYIKDRGDRMWDRLHTMVDEIEYLQTKSTHNKEGLQLLISSMTSISALAESEISQQISVASKRDSSIMMAIAVGTLTFLPATAMASIFAMPFFEWDAEPGEAVLGPRFGTYLATAIPITAVTLTFLFLWMQIVGRKDLSSTTAPSRSFRHWSSGKRSSHPGRKLTKRNSSSPSTLSV